MPLKIVNPIKNPGNIPNHNFYKKELYIYFTNTISLSEIIGDLDCSIKLNAIKKRLKLQNNNILRNNLENVLNSNIENTNLIKQKLKSYFSIDFSL